MLFKDIPIRKKLLRIILLINGIVFFVACIAFLVYEYYTFRKSTLNKVSTIGQIVSTNSTASIAFDNAEDAEDILTALKAEPHIVAAAIYDSTGRLFCLYTREATNERPVTNPLARGHRFRNAHLEVAEPILLNDLQLGTLYLKADMGAMYDRLRLYAGIVAIVMVLSFVLAWVLVQVLTRSITTSIVSLAQTASVVSSKQDYSVRSTKFGQDELGALTDAFNQMLDTIQRQNRTLRQFAHTLEQKVQERTAQLEFANKELESFSYSVSHDLRAPLRAIIGYTAILEEDYAAKLDDEGKRITLVIRNNTQKMGQLIDDLLAFSRMSRHDVSKATVDMTEMVHEVKDSLAGQYDYSRVHWDIETLPPAQANASLIRQVWINLVANALKYTSKKEQAHIQVGSYKQNNRVVYFVKDNGVGFNQQYGHKLFNIFQRLHNSEDFEGTGVGLALVQKIVVKQGGSVWAEAEENKGACFYFSLPEET